ncbi:MAG: hypothetical protein FIA95_09960 [Gemmatimonadetes bacterium]|nr:hypothetical protein [Gemmatimonadota bacterium]
MFRNVKIVVWALSLALLALVPREAAASCTEDYLTCLADAYPFAGGVSGAMSDVECGAGWLGCTIGKLKFW